jgi:hypothetical protein
VSQWNGDLTPQHGFDLTLVSGQGLEAVAVDQIEGFWPCGFNLEYTAIGLFHLGCVEGEEICAQDFLSNPGSARDIIVVYREHRELGGQQTW